MTAVLAYVNVRRLAWLAFAGALVALGFAVDGTSEWGHHAALIAGGILAGWKLKP